jgi:O-acetyl-ADP-ribose deacetylase (regulator of RNase III)
MPAISTGIFGFPKDRAAGIFYETIENYFRETESMLKVVRLTLFDQSAIAVFTEKWKTMVWK